ncbi:MAG TPA: FTR1 family protein, partial [Micromonosporaceae bacterium]
AGGASGTGAGPLLALIGGLLTAVILGYLLYTSAVRINLSTFFRWTGVLLILVAAGILKYGVHDFQEAGVLPGEDRLAFNITNVLDPSTWYANVLAGMFNITPAPTLLEVVAWVAYAVPVLVLFLMPVRRRPKRAATADAAAPAPAA